MKIQNNQQGVITDASQNNQQGVITGQNEINKFLSVQEPVGESVVRFKENFAVPVSPSNPYYPLFFHPELSEFKENIANEVSRLEKLNNLQSSKPALIEMELDPNDRKDLEEAKGKVNKNGDIIDRLRERIRIFYKALKEQDSLFDFKTIQIDGQEIDEVVAVNSGGLYLDVEVGKKMATEPYLENRRDIETHLQNTKVKQLEAEVKHLEAQTQAGIFFPPPQSTPIKTVPVV